MVGHTWAGIGEGYQQELAKPGQVPARALGWDGPPEKVPERALRYGGQPLGRCL